MAAFTFHGHVHAMVPYLCLVLCLLEPDDPNNLEPVLQQLLGQLKVIQAQQLHHASLGSTTIIHLRDTYSSTQQYAHR